MKWYDPMPGPPGLRFKGHWLAQLAFALWVATVLTAYYYPGRWLQATGAARAAWESLARTSQGAK
jgi:hypothetical protein